MKDLFASLDIIVLEQLNKKVFRLIGASPDWFKNFYPKVAPGKNISGLGECFPFLENFFIDAQEFWKKSSPGKLKSGIWIETDLLGKECAMEASAVCSGKKKILLIELLGTAYEEKKAILQKARENTLVKEYLEEEVRRRTADIRRREEEIALRLVWASESRDKETGAHIRRIGLYSKVLAKKLGWAPQQVEDISLAGSMHDIGKIGIPDRILTKPGKLTPGELEIMKNHTKIGAKILEGSDIPLLQMAKEIALCHHEKWDGSGYPQGLVGEAIPESARIVTIADVFDAIICTRVYKAAEPVEKVVAFMKNEKGKAFDPKMIEYFLCVLPEFDRIRLEFPGTIPNP